MNKDIIMFIVFMLVLLITSYPLGKYMARVYKGESVFGDRLFNPIEKGLYKLMGVQANEGMNWKKYCGHLFVFNMLGMLILFVLQLAQGGLPFNPENLGSVESWHLALNTAISFMTNTNWQAYSGETTMSYGTQMLGLTVQNFVSAATGVCVAIALMRGLVNKGTDN
ncbi:MAG: potassium-transporting ATPase subunit KdpA, partial [Phascolarctobacterium sp.]